MIHNQSSQKFRIVSVYLWAILSFALMIQSAPAAIAFRSSTSATVTSGSPTVNKPSGTASGDVLIATIATRGSTVTISPPNGWTLVRRMDNGTTCSLTVYFKVATPSEGASYVWTLGANTGADVGMMAFSGCDTNSPIGVSAGSTTSSGLTHAAPSITPGFNGAMIISWHSYACSSTWTPPSGMTEDVDVSSVVAPSASGISLSGNHLLQTSASATGTLTAIANSNVALGNAISLALMPINNAPILDSTKTPALATIAEDAAAPSGAVGTLVSSLVDFAVPAGQVDNVTDADASALLGIAVVATDPNFTAYYSLNGGATWTALGSVTTSTSLLLAADADNRIYLQPNLNVNGTFANALTFRAWDQSSGTDGATADTSTSGGTTAFSTATDGIQQTVTAVNDAPTASNLSAAETYTEDTPLNLIDIVVSDVDNSTLTVTLTLSNPSAGTLSTGTSGATTSTYNAGTGVWTASGSIAEVNTLLAGVTFTPALNFNSSFNIVTSVSDGSLSVTGSKAMTGIAVNDTPTASNLSAAQSYTEDTSLTLTAIVASDVDNTTLTVTLTLSNPSAGSLSTGTSGATTSTYNAGTGVWTASGPIAEVNTLLAGVTFTPAANFNNSFTIATSVSDGSLSVTGSKAMTGIAVNDAPLLDGSKTPTMVTVLEDPGAPSGAVGTLVSSLVDFAVPAGQVDNVTDADASALLGIAVVATDPNFTAYYSLNGGTTWTAFGNVTTSTARLLAADADNRIYLQPNLNVNGTFANALTFRAWDQSSGTDGGTADTSTSGGTTAFSTTTDGIQQTITAVNDAPTASNLSAAQSYTEDTPLTLTAIVASDVDNSTLTVTMTLSNPSAGTLSTGTSGATTSTYNAGTGVWTASGPFGDVNVLLAGVTFTPTPNFNSSFTIATSVSDGSLSVTGSKAMTGIAVNDAPVLDASKTPTLATITENAPAPSGAVGTLVSSLVDFAAPAGQVDNVTDADSGALLGIAVTGADSANGTWYFSIDGGLSWSLLGSVSTNSARLLAANANNRIYFQPNNGYSGTNSIGITFRAWDRTSGSIGSLADTSLNGGTTAFSTATDTAGIVVIMTLCPPGYYSADGFLPGVPAPPGYYVPGVGATNPTPAAIGFYVPGFAATNQIPAPTGRYCPVLGMRSPILAGDLDEDNLVSQLELDSAYGNYLTNSPWLYMTNVAGLGGTNVTFALSNAPAASLTVQFSTDLVNWTNLGSASPRYLFTDTNAPAVPQRYYRLSYP